MSDGKVVDLAAARLARTPHTSGPCVCLGCKHEWVGVAPSGTIAVECPACGTEKGVRAGTVFVDEPHWNCRGCDNNYLRVVAAGIYCPLCATAWNWDQITEAFSE